MPSLTPLFLPLIALIALGYVVGRLYRIDLKSVGTLVMFTVTPIVAFGSMAQLVFRKELLLLPLFAFIVASITGLTTKALGNLFLKQKSLGAFLPEATGMCNNGYMGVPIVLALFQSELIGVYFLMILGMVFFESTIGYYSIARGSISGREALKSVLRLPPLYAIIGGLGFSALELTLDPIFLKMWDSAKGAYTFLGMMLVGLALASYKKLEIHKDLFFLTVLGRYGVWTLVALSFIWLDHNFLHLFNNTIYQFFLLLGALPVAANLAAISAQCDFRPEVAAPLIVMTVILSFFLLPLVLPIILSFQMG